MAMANATRRTGAPRIFMALANNTHWLLKYLTYNFFWNSDGGFWVLGGQTQRGGGTEVSRVCSAACSACLACLLSYLLHLAWLFSTTNLHRSRKTLARSKTKRFKLLKSSYNMYFFTIVPFHMGLRSSAWKEAWSALVAFVFVCVLNCLPQGTHTYIGNIGFLHCMNILKCLCICLAVPHCEFSNVSPCGCIRECNCHIVGCK